MKPESSTFMERAMESGRSLGLRPSAAILVLALGVTALGAQPPRGVYIYSGPITAPPSGTLAEALRVNGIDGVTLVFDWSVIEPAPDKFTWDLDQSNPLDSWLTFVAGLGKSVRLSIRGGLGNAGTATPSWLFTPASLFPQATPLFFQASSHEGIGSCVAGFIAAPWDASFELNWQNMLNKLSQHLIATGAISIVKMVRLTGINRSTDEFRLPEETASGLSSCAKPVSSLQTWSFAGYTPSNLASGWKSILSAFASAFPNQYVDVAIIPNNLAGRKQNPFPEIDNAGCIYSPPVDMSEIPQNHCIDTNWQGVDQNQPLLNQASSTFGDRLVIEFENLNASSPANPYSIAVAQALGAGSAFQTNNYLGGTGNGSGAACSGTPGNSPMPCATADDYYNLIERGIYLQGPQAPLRARYLEVFDNDVIRTPVSPPFACAIWKAHIALTDYIAPVTTTKITKQIQTLPRGVSVETIVTFRTIDRSMTGQPADCSPLPVTTFFQIDNGAWQTGDNYTFSTPGTFKLNFYSVDFAGNIESVNTITVENL